MRFRCLHTSCLLVITILSLSNFSLSHKHVSHPSFDGRPEMLCRNKVTRAGSGSQPLAMLTATAITAKEAGAGMCRPVLSERQQARFQG